MPPTLLIVLDGWGERSQQEDNAIALAKLPHYHSFLQQYPHTLIDASGAAVGLPPGLMGNSEVGHLTLGAGRVVLLGLTRIYQAIEDGSFFNNSVLSEAMDQTPKNASALHLMGLVSDGAVHSHQDHIYALLEMARRKNLKQVFLHVFTDGRDTPPQSALGYIDALEKKIREIGVGEIATVSGRYYAMDRDQRWERTQLAYQALVNGIGEKASSAMDAIEKAYRRQENDEFIRPTVLTHPSGQPIATIRNHDAVIFFNFRADRARQISRALTQPNFTGFERSSFPKLSCFACFSEYEKSLNLPVAFPKIDIHETFPEILSAQGLRQLRIAETEKYAHVTYFFSGGREEVFEGEDRVLIPSPKEVATYDQKPEMSAYKTTEELMVRLKSGEYDFVICNFANPDMVGHTGMLHPAIHAVEAVDACLGKIVESVLHLQGEVVITADHGNCETMKDSFGVPHTAHTTNWVPFLLIGQRWKKASLRSDGKLTDVAPTLLQMMGLTSSSQMSGKSLIHAG